MKRKKKFLQTFAGATLFFVTTSVVVTVGILVFAAISSRTQNKAVVTAVMFLAIVFLALVATVIDFVRRKITIDKPVQEILTATDEFASGNFSTQLRTHDFGKYNEYDYIKENLNKMAAELSKTEMLHNDFIANVSHELKTPLAVIQNYATVLQQENLDVESRKKCAETLSDAAKRLTSLVSNMLKLNKLENQQLSFECKKVRIDEMLAQSVLAFEEIIDAKKLNVNCDFDEVEMETYPDCLEIVWNNLLSNAVKFTEEGGSIGVVLKRADGMAVVQISDTGCGISPETGAHIFDKFFQGDTSHAKEGNGLGLALVKKVIDLIGGEISVESQPGKGSVFTVALKEV
ncbi:MAG: ATP-binding protein [Candidatus Fimimonas sp.]